MKSMKQWVFMALCALAATSFSACGDDEKEDDPKDPSSTTESYILIKPTDKSIASFKVPLPELKGTATYENGSLSSVDCQVEEELAKYAAGSKAFFWVSLMKGENDMAGKWIVQPEFGIQYGVNGKFLDIESSRHDMPEAENVSITDKTVSFSFKGNGHMDAANAEFNYVYKEYEFTYEAFVTINIVP